MIVIFGAAIPCALPLFTFKAGIREALKNCFSGIILKPADPPSRLEICQKIYTTRFSGKKFYTIKVRKLRLFLDALASLKTMLDIK